MANGCSHRTEPGATRTGTEKRFAALRRNASAAEQTLWQHLRRTQLGTRFRRQYGVDGYALDFYAPRAKLAIEVDGDSHFTASGREYDHLRTTYLRAFGIEVLRFTNMDILQNIEGVLTTIEAAVKRRTATSPLPPPW